MPSYSRTNGHSSWTAYHCETKALCSFTPSGTMHPLTQCHNQCDPIPKLNYSKNSLHFIKPEASLPCSHQLITCPYSQANESSSWSPNIFFLRSILILPSPPCVTFAKMFNLHNQEATASFPISKMEDHSFSLSRAAY